MRGLVLALALIGCGGSAPPPAEPTPPPPAAPAPEPTRQDPPPAPGGAMDTDALITKMQAFTDQLCACKDQPCAQHVSEDMSKWAEEQAKNSAPPKLTDDQTKRITDISQRMGTCMQQAMGGAGASPTP